MVVLSLLNKLSKANMKIKKTELAIIIYQNYQIEKSISIPAHQEGYVSPQDKNLPSSDKLIHLQHNMSIAVLFSQHQTS